MIIFDFLSANWDWLLAIVVIIVGVILRLRSLWKGNVIEWLVAICADAETIYGGGTGYLKLRYVYDAFLGQFPALSKYVAFDTFSKWVDKALANLKEKLKTNEKINAIVTQDTGGATDVE